MKELVRNPNGFSATLWKWFYNTSTLPQSYCSYFWSNIVAGIFGLPLFFIYLPTKVLGYIFEATDRQKEEGFWAFELGKNDSWSMRFVLSMFFWIALAIIVIYLWGLAAFLGGFNDTAAHVFILLSIIGSLAGIGIYFGKAISSDPVQRQKESIGVAVDSFMNKYCPKITWKQDE